MSSAEEKIRRSPFNYFTMEEINLICMYSKDNRQKAIDGMYHALAEVRDFDMVSLICRTLDKLQLISNTEFEALEFNPVYE